MVPVLICANCQSAGHLACQGCLLVLYCGKECQTAHWSKHKFVCKSISKPSWQPQWVIENRDPAFIGNAGPQMVHFGGNKFLWGNIPAIDILRLEVSEEASYPNDLNLLFAASGDLRNVIQTIASLPDSYGKKLSLTINDKDMDIVARNVIILLVAFVCEGVDKAVDCILHIWYSAFMQTSHVEILGRARLFVEDVVNKTKSKTSGAMLGRTWEFSSRTLRVVLSRQDWVSLLSYFDIPIGLTAKKAQEIRTSVTLSPSRVDYRDRRMLAQVPAARICGQRFRDDGILLSFGHSRAGFEHPNPTFFQGFQWEQSDSSDPLDGWSLPEILSTDAGPASNDISGKFHVYLKTKLSVFLRYLATHDAGFRLFRLNAAELSTNSELKNQQSSFARIEVSNICDGGYLGIARAIGCLAPLLQKPEDNPHGTLIALFMNAVAEMHQQSENQDMIARLEMMQVMKFLPPSKGFFTGSIRNPENVLRMSALPIVRDGDMYFNKYMDALKFKEIERIYGVSMKQPQTIIEPWPLHLKLQPHEKGAKEEFDLLNSSGHCGSQRYVEWRRTK